MKLFTLPACFRTALFALLALAVAPGIHAQIINTVVGDGTAGNSGDGGPATAANIRPYYVALDTSGNLYISDGYYNAIRKVGLSGTISTIAGISYPGFSGDGGPATAAALSSPGAIAADNKGNIYIADAANLRVRKINAAGIISTIAGSGTGGYGSYGGAATNAKIGAAAGIAVDGTGNVYISDGNARILKVDTFGIIRPIAGNGSVGLTGDGGAATAAALDGPSNLVLDASGNIYFIDQSNQRIRKISTSGIISTFAGSAGGFSGDGGPATNAKLNNPSGIAIDPGGNLYIADRNNNRIRKITPAGIIHTIAGNGTAAFGGDGGPAISALLNNPRGLATDLNGHLYIADMSNYRVREINTCITPNAATITGTDSTCPGSATTLADTATGGTWVSTNTSVATVSSSGVVTGVASGGTQILYIVTNSCGADTAKFSFGVLYCPSGVNNLNNENNVHIYPNPTSGSFTLNIPSTTNEEVHITITNMLGEKVKELSVSTNKETAVQLNVRTGVYQLTITTNGERLTKKLVVE